MGRGMGQTQRSKKLQQWLAYRREALKMGSLVQKGRRKNFVEENGGEDPWKVIRFAKDPWGIKQ